MVAEKRTNAKCECCYSVPECTGINTMLSCVYRVCTGSSGRLPLAHNRDVGRKKADQGGHSPSATRLCRLSGAGAGARCCTRPGRGNRKRRSAVDGWQDVCDGRFGHCFASFSVRGQCPHAQNKKMSTSTKQTTTSNHKTGDTSAK